MTKVSTEVLIVGAGPTGLALACQLIRYGIDFVIIDQKEATTPFSKAIGVQARTLEIYEQMGLAEPLIARGRKTERVRLMQGGEARAEVELSRLGQGMSPYPYLLIVEQGKHEALLYQFIRENQREVSWQWILEDFKQDEQGVSATTVNAGGVSRQIDARYMVACDGARSPVRIALGMSFEGSTFERLFYVADVKLKWDFPHDMLTACLSRDRSTAFFPMPGEDNYRIVGVFPEGFDKEEGEIVYDEIERRILVDTELELDIYKVNWFSTYKVHSRHVNKFSDGRCFLAGDSAHIHSPVGAQGMNTGIQDGYNLAWKLALAVRGSAPAKILDTYNEERIEVAKRLLETTDRMFDLLMNPAWLLSFVRTRIFPQVANFLIGLESVNQFVFPLVSQIGINYRNHSLSFEGDQNFEIKAGDRMPYLLIDHQSIYDRLHRPSFHLLTFSDDPNSFQTLSDEMESRYRGLVDHHVLPPSARVTEVFGTERDFNVLLRPDNYLGLISADTSSAPVKRYLDEVIGLKQ